MTIAREADNKASWVCVEQVYERLALQMTALDIKSAFLNQPIEINSLRTEFRDALGMGDNRTQLLLRFGYAAAMPRSLRGPVDEVLI